MGDGRQRARESVRESARPARIPANADGSAEFAEFYRRWRPLVHRAALRSGASGDDLHDIEQEVFTRLWVSGRWETIRYPKTYLWKASRREALKLRRRPEREAMAAAQLAHALPVPTMLDAELRRRERRASLLRLLRDLPPRCRAVMRRKYVRGLPSPDIAEALQITVKGVERQVTRGVQLLRERVGTPAAQEWLSTFEDVGR